MTDLTSTLLAGRYRLTRVVGAGATAVVYAALDELLSIEVAIKLFHSTIDAEAADRQIREASLAMNLQHPAIIRCDGAYTADGYRFIVMEYLSGQSLRTLLEEGAKLSVEKTIAIVSALASALTHTHDRGILHRDISPANILVGDDGSTIKLIDFGIAKPSERAGSATQTSGLGTAAYAAPEQLLGKPTEQSDLYGMGAVAFHCLTGRPPQFARKGETKWALPSETPTWLADLIIGCLSIDPTRRPSSAAAVMEMIARAQSHGSGFGWKTLGMRRIVGLLLVAIASLFAFISLTMSSFYFTRIFVGRFAAVIESVSGIEISNPKLVAALSYAAIADDDPARLQVLFRNRQMTATLKRQLFSEGTCDAGRAGHSKALEALFALGAELEESCGRSPSGLLESALVSGSVETLRVIVKQQIDLGLAFKKINAFELVAERQDLAMFTELLRSIKPLPSPPRVYSYPPLWAAKYYVHHDRLPNFVKAVADAGPVVANMRDFHGNSSIHIAAKLARPSALAMFLEVPGIDAQLYNDEGLAPIHVVLLRNPADTGSFRSKALRGLITHGVDVNQPTRPGGETPLIFAVKHGEDWAVAELLAVPTVDVNAKDARGRTALDYTVEHKTDNGTQMAKLLREHGAAEFAQ